MTNPSTGFADRSAEPARITPPATEPAVPATLQQLFRAAEKFCFSWPVHTVPAGDRSGAIREG